MGQYVRDGLLYEIEAEFLEGGTLIDFGGGISVKNGILSRMGMHVKVIDLFSTYYSNSPSGGYGINRFIDYLSDSGVESIEGNFNEIDISEIASPGSVDVMSMLHVLEHLHDFPRKLILNSIELLREGGVFRIETPNAANLRKRLALLFGKTNYPDISSYYSCEKWYGHVREYTVTDYEYVGREISKVKNINYKIFGKNYYGSFARGIPPSVHNSLDQLFQRYPGICGSLFFEIEKKGST